MLRLTPTNTEDPYAVYALRHELRIFFQLHSIELGHHPQVLRVAMWESMPTWNKSKHHLQKRGQSGFWRHVQLFLLRQPNQQLCSKKTTTVVLPFGSWVIIERELKRSMYTNLGISIIALFPLQVFEGNQHGSTPCHVPLANPPNSLSSRQSSRAGGPTHM